MKQRLTGTIIIGCLAIIFIPILLDGEGVTPPAMNTTIPEAPPMPVVPDTTPVRPEISADTLEDSLDESDVEPESESGAAVASSEPEPPPTPERPRLTPAGVPETWAVRLGSFGEAANAEALVERLRNNGHKAFSRPIQTSRGPLTGVYVGPVLTETIAANLQQDLARAFELEGIVVQFSIEELEE